jgi:hypothetical protein
MTGPPRTAQELTAMNASMSQWSRGMNRGIITIKINLWLLISHLPCFTSWWPPCHKNHTVEMVQFLTK